MKYQALFYQKNNEKIFMTCRDSTAVMIGALRVKMFNETGT